MPVRNRHLAVRVSDSVFQQRRHIPRCLVTRGKTQRVDGRLPCFLDVSPYAHLNPTLPPRPLTQNLERNVVTHHINSPTPSTHWTARLDVQLPKHLLSDGDDASG